MGGEILRSIFGAGREDEELEGSGGPDLQHNDQAEYDSGPATHSAEDLVERGYMLVPRFDIEASAGPGALSDAAQIVDHLAFKEDFIRRTLRADPDKLVLISGIGDSMEPTIRSGDLLLVDTGVAAFIDDAIYVIAIDGHLYVKRIQKFFGGAVTVKSDNAAYVEQTLSPDEAEAVHVAGRVRWIGRMT